MIGNDAFCPKTGASLSRQSHYDEHGRPRRAVQADGSALDREAVGELTNGAVRSSRIALLTYFRRCHARHAEGDEALYRAASLALKRLKSAAEGRQEWDVHVWYALKRRLDRDGFDVDWMDGHAELWCPHCHSRLRYTAYGSGDIRARCGVDCTGRPEDCLRDLRDVVASLYRQAFDEANPPESHDFLQG